MTSSQLQERTTIENGPSPRRRWPVLLGLVVLAGLALQYGLFRQYALREVVWAYPSAHDQTYYLTISYDTYEHILTGGLTEGVRYGARLRPPAGMLLHQEAALLYLFAGPGRLSALTVIFLHFAALQAAVVATAAWLVRRWSLALIAWGVLLCALSPFFFVGGLMDFRIDFAASCAFGVVVCLALRSGLFASRPWSLAVAAAATYLVLLRFLTAVYLTGIAVPFALYVALRLWRGRDPEARHAERVRLGNMALAGLLAAGAALPGLWYHRYILHDYYVVGHVTGPEVAIRLLESAGRDLWFYPRSLVQTHAGPVFARLAAGAALAVGLLGWAVPRRRLWLALPALAGILMVGWKYEGPWLWWACAAALATGGGLVALVRYRNPEGSTRLPARPALAFLALALLIPLAALSADRHCSHVVANIALVPLFWLVLTPVLLAVPSRDVKSQAAEGALAVLGILALAAGAYSQLSHYGQHGLMTLRRADNERLLQLHDRIAQTVLDCNLLRPTFALTSNPDHLPGRISEVLLYERHGVHRTFLPLLGGFYDVSERDALRAIDASDFVVLSRPQTVVTPFEKAMAALLPQLRAYCQQHLVHLGTFRIFGDDVALYTRGIRVEGGESGWITADGLTVQAPGRVLRGRRLRLSGPAWGLLDARPVQVRAMLTVPGRSPATIPATLVRRGEGYALELDFSQAGLAPETSTETHLTFDHFFVPRDLRLGTDDRRLVLPTPQEVCLVP
jgi:hypothetical protein